MKKRFLIILLFISSFFYLNVANAKETEIVTNEELSNYEVIEPVTISYVNLHYINI